MHIAKTSFIAAVAGLAGAAQATYFTGFELPDFNAGLLTGQQGWTNSPVAGSLAYNVSAYAGNAAGLVQNPVGGNQFILGVSATGPARAQHAVAWTNSVWTVSYDMAPTYSGALPSAINLGSASLNHNTLLAGQFQGFIALNNFNVPANPAAGWHVDFNVFNAGGTSTPNQSPGAFWANLQTNHWYRQYVTVDFAAHQILTVTIVDLHTGLGASVNPVGWYLDGGANSTLPLPDAWRFFTGGSAGSTMGWDNLQAIPGPAGALALAAGGLLLAARRRR
jgi:hypothetical protein